MTSLCVKCGAQLSSSWSFCPRCGTTVVSQPSVSTEIEKAPVKYAFSGLLFGLIVTPMCIIVGVMLCLTGLGAFLGVPLIIGGVLAPLLGPIVGIGELRGKCPSCGIELNNIIKSPSFTCHKCGERIVVQNRRFVKAA
jgi:predicted RNA-binding Zn-ribbon protein involved in translation (DUF1610 family)